MCFMLYSITLSIKKQTPTKKPNAVKDRWGGWRVGMTMVKDSMGFFKASLKHMGKEHVATYSSSSSFLVSLAHMTVEPG